MAKTEDFQKAKLEPEKGKSKGKKVDYLPVEQEESYLSWVDKQIREHPVVKTHHGKWKELIEWVNGNQYSEWSDDSNSVISVPLKKRKKKVVINLMKPLGEAYEGKLSLIYKLAGFPNSGEIKDIEGAKVSTKMLSHTDYVNAVEDRNEDMKHDLVNTGNAFSTWQWSKQQHGYIKGKEGAVEQEGELSYRIPSVFNIRPDPVGKCREEWRWLIEIMEVAVEDILVQFPKLKKPDLYPEDEVNATSTEADKYAGMNEPIAEKDMDEETLIVALYWERSSKKFPSGRYMVSVPAKVLWKGKNEALGEIPYWHYGFKRRGNSLWHTGPMHHVQVIQRDYNRTVSITSEHIEGWRAKMVAPPDAILKDGAFTADSFEILEADFSKGEIKPLQMPELSPQVGAHIERLASAFDTVSNVHEVSYSQLPKYASRAPASLFSMMLEQENLKINPMLKRINKALREQGVFRLKMVDKYYSEPRLIKVVGEPQAQSIQYFKGADLEGNFDVKLEVGASLHQSQTMQTRMLIELKQSGILEEKDKNKIIKLLNIGDISEELRADMADESRASRENQAYITDLYKKKPQDGGVFVYKHDDHEMHLDMHTNLSKTEEAQRWKQDKWDKLQAHIEEHWQFWKIESGIGQALEMQQQPGAGGMGGGMPGIGAPGGGRPGPIPSESARGVTEETNVEKSLM